MKNLGSEVTKKKNVYRISDKDAVELARAYINEWNAERNASGWNPSSEALKFAADKLVQLAQEKKSYDNVTVIIMAFQW